MKFDKVSDIASIIGLILTLLSYVDSFKSICLVIILIIFILLLIRSNKQRKIDSKYLKGESKVREVNNKINLKALEIKKKNFEGIIHELSDLCTEISEIFKEIKDEKIGICIKYINGTPENPYVKTLCRDFYSKEREEKYNDNNYDYISKNTDFNHIIELMNSRKKFNEIYYQANYLANEHQYCNTHLKDIRLSSNFLSYYKRRKLWPLPYKSTIVVPFLSPDNKCISGFLCIDSPKSNGFIKERDIAIMQQIALFMRDIIYHVCNEHLKKKENEK